MKGSTVDNWYLIISLFIVSTVRIGFIMLLKEIDENTILLKNTRIQKDKLKLEESNKTKDKLFSIIAHDLRSPFNSILGFSGLLIENVKTLEIEKSEEYLGFINSSAQNTLVLLDNLLNWAKSQTGQINFNPQQINLSSTINELVEGSNSLAAAKEISLCYNKTEEVTVYADEDMLKIVLRNLISNAIKFTKPSGNINILAEKGQNQIEITISDNGIGMNEESKAKLFKVGTNKTSIGTANEKGSGLGLILCKELVEKQGGKIWIESELGKGSDFKFTLPLKS
ncbi:sensor histidine kinase KdpD [Ancylomarina sp. 16SWW S1-10-2]|uniref:sensor histidine kinase n=1 Tax=Ancylomarina sp. 16SWW S1-10-2 TaxID=2499681 RepID=UPI00189EAA4A|nr:HAMP domain-containing sensor histidine kinase [Ancylomarina sp. 16SWW S1-10-2]